MSHSPTPEQAAIVLAATSTTDNLLISALAGAAKTSTLELIAAALPRTSMLCLAFNKHIQKEMALRLPSNCKCQTLNSLGLAAWKATLTCKVNVDLGKGYRLLTQHIDTLDPNERKECYASLGLLTKTFRQAKAAGHIPDSITQTNTRLIGDDEFLSETEEELSAIQAWVLISALEDSIAEGFLGRIDFDDMLLLPTVFRAIYPRHSLILVDEAQDLSELNHAMLEKIARKRIIAVGDSCQAIYAFRGASSDSMTQLRDRFSMTEFRLSTCFRCPEEIVDHVRWRAPHMQSWPGTPAGLVAHINTWEFSDIPENSAIICRNNAPLFSTAVAMLRSGRYPNLWGNDLAAGMVKQLKKFGSMSMSRASLLEQIATWEKEKLVKTRSPSTIIDRAECFRIFARSAETLGGAIVFAQQVFDTQGPVHLLTGHKSKGHEWERVYFLESGLVSTEGQDPNLRYVICTRATRELRYITRKGCLDMVEVEG